MITSHTATVSKRWASYTHRRRARPSHDEEEDDQLGRRLRRQNVSREWHCRSMAARLPSRPTTTTDGHVTNEHVSDTDPHGYAVGEEARLAKPRQEHTPAAPARNGQQCAATSDCRIRSSKRRPHSAARPLLSPTRRVRAAPTTCDSRPAIRGRVGG